MIIFSSNGHVLEFIMTAVQCEHGSNTRILVVLVNAKLCSEIFESGTFIAIFKFSLKSAWYMFVSFNNPKLCKFRSVKTVIPRD